MHLRIYPAFARVSKIVGLVRVVYILQCRQQRITHLDEIGREVLKAVAAVPDKYRLDQAYESPPATAISRPPCLTNCRHLWLYTPQTYVSLFTSLPRVDRIPLGATKQVRALASPTDDLVLSASRDSTAILWQKPNPSAPFEHQRTFKPGSGYVNAVTVVPPTPDAPKGVFLVPPLPFRPVEMLVAEN